MNIRQLITLLTFTLISIYSCTKTSSTNVSITPIKFGTTMDPSRVYFLNEYYLIENLSTRLVEMDSKTGYKLMLASEINQKSDLMYEIKIRNSRFSNGEKIELPDVLNSFKRAMGNRNSHIKFSELVKNISIKDDKLVVELQKKTKDFLYYLTLIDLSILHRSQLKDELKAEDWGRATSGPFFYAKDNDSMSLIKNPHYQLSSLDYPDKIILYPASGRDSFADFQSRRVDFGEFNLNSFEKHLPQLSKENDLEVIGNTGDMITFIALNARKPKFKNEHIRRWLQKKIMQGFTVPEKYGQVARKSYQFFTPQVRGFLEEDKVIREVDSWNIDTNTVPEELREGIEIHTYKRAYEVTIRSLVESLESILGIPVRIKDDVPSPEFETFAKSGKFEAFLVITSMDQVIAGESVNLYYFSSFPLLMDVNKKIRPLMERYKHSSENSHDVIKEISRQMTLDSECVPLFYVASPFFFNKRKVDISELDELTYFNFWKLKIK